MTVLLRRVRAATARLDEVCVHTPEEPASVRWLKVLRIVLPALERQDPAPAYAIDRVRRSVELLAEYVATSLHSDPWAHLEYYCNGCLMRMNGTGPGWDGRRLAFLEADYDDRMREIEAIEQGRRGLHAPNRLHGPAIPAA